MPRDHTTVCPQVCNETLTDMALVEHRRTLVSERAQRSSQVRLHYAIGLPVRCRRHRRQSVFQEKRAERLRECAQTTLSEGVRFERRLFHSCFAIEDQKEGMAAFVEKRKPSFRNR